MWILFRLNLLVVIPVSRIPGQWKRGIYHSKIPRPCESLWGKTWPNVVNNWAKMSQPFPPHPSLRSRWRLTWFRLHAPPKLFQMACPPWFWVARWRRWVGVGGGGKIHMGHRRFCHGYGPFVLKCNTDYPQTAIPLSWQNQNIFNNNDGDTTSKYL